MRSLQLIIILLLFVANDTLSQTDSIQKLHDSTHKIQIKTINDTVFLKPTSATYSVIDRFDWKLWLPSITALLVLLISNIVTLYKINRDTKEAVKKEIIISKVKIERERLEKFYDPIYTTLMSNSAIFNSYGPKTFPQDSGSLETEASFVWKQLVENVIIPNNKKICTTIQQFSHLINSNDKIDHYLEYLVHAESYEHFIKFPNSLHKAFKFPSKFICNIENYRNITVDNLKSIEQKLIS